MRWLALGLVLAGGLGCKGSPSTPTAPANAPAGGPDAAVVAPPAPPAPTALDSRSPAQFADQWITVLKTLDPAAREKAAEVLVRGWIGRRYRWTGLALASLCVEATRTCGLQVFAHDLPGRKALGGTLPLVSFEPAAWARLKAECAGKDRCVLTFTAILSELTADYEKALRFVFADGRIEALRDPSPEDKWFRPPAPRSGDPSRLKTGEPTKPKLEGLVRKVF